MSFSLSLALNQTKITRPKVNRTGIQEEEVQAADGDAVAQDHMDTQADAEDEGAQSAALATQLA